MKKALAAILAVSLALGLAGCGAAGTNGMDAQESLPPLDTTGAQDTAPGGETPEEAPGETGGQVDAEVQAEIEEQARREQEAAEMAMNGEWGIPAGQHEGIGEDNMVTVMLQELVPMPDRELYLFMKDGATYTDVLPSSEYLMKPYTLGALDGMLFIGFGGPIDTAVTADNAETAPELMFSRRGAGWQDYEYAKACFEEYGVAFWTASRPENNEPTDWDNPPKNMEYSITGTFAHGGVTYTAILHTLTEQDEPYYYEAYEAALGEGWPILTVTLSYYGK